MEEKGVTASGGKGKDSWQGEGRSVVIAVEREKREWRGRWQRDLPQGEVGPPLVTPRVEGGMGVCQLVPWGGREREQALEAEPWMDEKRVPKREQGKMAR